MQTILNGFKASINHYLKHKQSSKIAFIDLDETLLRQKNVAVYLKELIRTPKELESVLSDDNKTIQTYKLVINNIINTKIDLNKLNDVNTELLLINNILYKDLDELILEKNDFIKLTKYFLPTKENMDIIIDILKNINQNQFQIATIDDKNQKQYFTLNQLKNKTFLDGEIIKIDFKSNNIDFIKKYYSYNERLQIISPIKGKEFDLNSLNKYSQIMMKTKIKKKELNESVFDLCDTIEVQKKFTPTTFNNAFTNKGNNILTPDFSDFSSAKKFIKNTTIFENTKESILNYFYNKNALMVALTARDEFDEKDLVLDFFQKNGLPFDYLTNFGIEMIFSSSIPYHINNINIDDKFKVNVVVMKKIIYINEALSCGKFNEVIMYEDNKIMLEALQNYLELNHPKIKQTLILVEDETLLKFKKLSEDMQENLTKEKEKTLN